ncbi:MAG TPA: bacteriohopanetetrol glucosamine biosynthesis glycosyltransferase HpnI [Candidatus Eremiobacteraceae bacterium]|nr:bacteriohopanetetrol glucosamine biosynthesis glycosyltransferase HpnI [Candidatus Eremiobacteraceae bacterium]
MRSLVAFALLAASAAGVAYLALALQRTVAFGRRKARPHPLENFTPPVTVLKPLCGAEPELFENLSSFCDQDYPSFQVVFGVRDPDDPAADVARRVIERFPDRDLSLVIDNHVRAANLKMANVLNMTANAKHDILIVADSDVKVLRSYLRDVVAPFADERVGAVTTLYRAQPSASEGEHARAHPVPTLAAMFVNEHFAPSALVAVALSPMDFCLGATMAVTRKALESIGGFQAVASYLADDQMLGKLVRAQGLRVELAAHVVETTVVDADLPALWAHELRWARTMHAAQPLGYSFSFITYALPLAVLYALVDGSALVGAGVVAVTLTLRVALHYAARSALDVSTTDAPWLIFVRDALGLGVWAAHFFGRGVRWRDRLFTIDARGRLLPQAQADRTQD